MYLHQPIASPHLGVDMTKPIAGDWFISFERR